MIKKKQICSIVLAGLTLFSLTTSLLGCSSDNKKTNNSSQTINSNKYQEDLNKKIQQQHEEEKEEKAKKDKLINFINQKIKNPFTDGTPYVSNRELRANLSKYVGQTVIVGPLEVDINHLQEKQLDCSFIAKYDANMEHFVSDLDAPIDVSYKYLQKTNKNPYDFMSQDSPLFYAKGKVEVERNSLHEPGLVAQEIIFIGNSRDIEDGKETDNE